MRGGLSGPGLLPAPVQGALEHVVGGVDLADAGGGALLLRGVMHEAVGVVLEYQAAPGAFHGGEVAADRDAERAVVRRQRMLPGRRRRRGGGRRWGRGGA